ncbi:MAG: hypothetical protein ABI912_09320 [Actinomycetota bacterium]
MSAHRQTAAGGARASRTIAAFLLLLAGGALMWPATASAKCVGPDLSFEKPSDVLAPATEPILHTGAKTTVYGEWFHSGCNDTGGGPCSGEHERGIKGIELVLTQGERSWSFGRHNAKGRYFAVEWAVDVPAELHPGPATITATAKMHPRRWTSTCSRGRNADPVRDSQGSLRYGVDTA